MSWFGNKEVSAPAAVAVQEPEIEIPVMTAAPKMGDEELQEYIKITNELGIQSSDLTRERLLQYLKNHQISIYNYSAVHKYLTKKFGELNWGWRPLRAADKSKLNNRGDDEKGNGQILNDRCYREAVPFPVLVTVRDVAAAVPNVYFYVSDLNNRKNEGDPFLAVIGAGTEIYVIERWDEPSFRG